MCIFFINAYFAGYIHQPIPIIFFCWICSITLAHIYTHKGGNTSIYGIRFCLYLWCFDKTAAIYQSTMVVKCTSKCHNTLVAQCTIHMNASS